MSSIHYNNIIIKWLGWDNSLETHPVSPLLWRNANHLWSIVFVIFSRTAYSVDGPYEQPSSASSSYAQPWPPSTTCPSCGEPSHPAFSERILCGLGRCPVAKFDGKCNACHNPIKRGEHNIANVNGNWFHKACTPS